jgi:hypothetical protein
MPVGECEHCGLRPQRISGLTRHTETCRVRLRRKRRLKPRSKNSVTNDHLREAGKRRRISSSDVDEEEISIPTSEISFAHWDETIVEDNQLESTDVPLLSSSSGILSTSSSIRIQNYEEATQ